MKKFLTYFFFIAGGFLILTKAWTILFNEESDEIKIVPTVFDIGTIDVGSPPEASAEYWIINKGRKKLRISRVIPDCTCTSYRLQSNVIKSGDSTKIFVAYDKRVPGFFSHYVDVYYNSGAASKTLTITGLIKNSSSKGDEYLSHN